MLKIKHKKQESSDQVLHQYRVSCDGKEGLLTLSNQIITFLIKKGFFRPKYSVSMALSYQKIRDVYACASHKLALQTNGQTYYFITFGDIYADIVVDEIKELKKAS
jgi:hypothetical protein